MTQQAVERAWTLLGRNERSCTSRVEVTNTHTRRHTQLNMQYLQQNTEEMDLLSSPDATQGEGKQNDRFGRKRKKRHRKGRDRG